LLDETVQLHADARALYQKVVELLRSTGANESFIVLMDRAFEMFWHEGRISASSEALAMLDKVIERKKALLEAKPLTDRTQ
jgi:hypothetical protein